MTGGGGWVLRAAFELGGGGLGAGGNMSSPSQPCPSTQATKNCPFVAQYILKAYLCNSIDSTAVSLIVDILVELEVSDAKNQITLLILRCETRCLV